MNLGSYLKDKKIGFWFSVAITVLFLVSGILYLAIAPGLDEYVRFAKMVVSMGFLTFVGVFSIVGAVISIILIATKQYKFLGYVQFAFGLLGFVFFVYASFQYIFEMYVGIEITFAEMYPSFVVMGIFFLSTLVLSIANVFLKQTSTAKLEEVAHE